MVIVSDPMMQFSSRKFANLISVSRGALFGKFPRSPTPCFHDSLRRNNVNEDYQKDKHSMVIIHADGLRRNGRTPGWADETVRLSCDMRSKK